MWEWSVGHVFGNAFLMKHIVCGGYYGRMFVGLRGGFEKKELALRTELEVDTSRLEEAFVFGTWKWKAVLEKNDYRIACLTDTTHDVLFARTYGCTIGNGSLGCSGECLAFGRCQGFGCDAATAYYGLPYWPFKKPVVAKGGEL